MNQGPEQTANLSFPIGWNRIWHLFQYGRLPRFHRACPSTFLHKFMQWTKCKSTHFNPSPWLFRCL